MCVYRQTDRPDRTGPTDRQTDRRTHMHKHTHTHIYIYIHTALFPEPSLAQDAKEGAEVSVGRSTLPAFVLVVSGPLRSAEDFEGA